MDSFVQDLRYAMRGLIKTPGFTATAVLTLALTIGATTGIFSIVDAVIFRPLSFHDPDRLFVIHESLPRVRNFAPMVPVNGAHYQEWRRSVPSFEEVALLGVRRANLTGAGEPEFHSIGRVSASLFRMLGVQPQLGRNLLGDEDAPGRDRVAVINDELWRRRFGADPAVIGRTIYLDDEPHQVVGVLPRAFHFPRVADLYGMTVSADRPEIWTPIGLRPQELTIAGSFNFASIARVRPDVPASQALAELKAVQTDIAKQSGELDGLDATLVPLQEQMTGRLHTGFQLMLAAVCVVLAIGCANIASLHLIRIIGRRREIAIRTAIGASTSRLVRQTVTEGFLLAGVGGAIGVAIAYAIVQLFSLFAPVDLPLTREIQLDARVLLFAVAISGVTGLVFGVVPVAQLIKVDPQEVMKSSSRSVTADRSGSRIRATLVTLEVCLTTISLLAAGLLFHSFAKIMRVDKGFQPERVAAMTLNLSGARYPNGDARSAFVRTLLGDIRAMPGVASVGVSDLLPLGGENGNSSLAVEGAATPRLSRPIIRVQAVSPDYFRTLGIALLNGRIFTETDQSRRVAVISAATAARAWPGRSPLGQRFRFGPDTSPWIEVSGVVGDVRGVSLTQDAPLTVYQPYWQSALFLQAAAVVRTAGDPLSLSGAIRNTVRKLDPEMGIPALQTMDDVVSESVAQRQFQMRLVVLFGILAMGLAALGIYGVVSYSVAQRTNEMGVRMALGAAARDIGAIVLRLAMLPVAVGLATGLVAAAALGTVMRSLLFGITPMDPVTVMTVAIVVPAVAVLASCVPALRAVRIDPMAALRTE